MRLKKTVISLVFIVLLIILVSVFWRRTFLLCIFLIILALLKHKISPSPNEFSKYIIIAILGPATESLIIYFGGAWHYSQT